MDFILGLFVIVGLTYLLLRHFGPLILQWLVKRYMRRLDPQAKQQTTKRKGWRQASSHHTSAKSQARKEKLDMRDIAKKKFEKDQGEYIDFEEE